MNTLVNTNATFSHHVLQPEKLYPNNLSLPVMVYNKALHESEITEDKVKELLQQNNWTNAWCGSIYNYHHYHTRAHEVLAVISGSAMLELGGPDGNIQTLSKGDVVVLPAGVVHKMVGGSEDFKVVGAYPDGQDYDMNECSTDGGKKEEKKISKVPLPDKDPIYGEDGPLHLTWCNRTEERSSITKEKQF